MCFDRVLYDNLNEEAEDKSLWVCENIDDMTMKEIKKYVNKLENEMLIFKRGVANLKREIENSRIKEISSSVNTGHNVYHSSDKYYLVRVDKIKEILKWIN